MAEPVRAIDPATLSSAPSPAEDFYRHVNRAWLEANPVPPEYGSWGAFHEVHERNEELLHRLMQGAASDPGPDGTPRAMVGAYFAAGMDEETIRDAGTAPLEPLFEFVADIRDATDIANALVALQRAGVEAFHGMGTAPDFENSDAYLAYLGQGGLGLPERDYYLRDDDRSKELRAAYGQHVAAQLVNLGDEPERARATAGAILELETSLATVSYPAEKMRDVELTLNRYDVAALDKLMPRFGLTQYARDLGITSSTVSIDNPGFFETLDRTLAETSIETIKHYLRWHVVRSYASALTPEFEDEAFAFYGTRLGGQKQLKPRWKRMLAAATADIGEQVSRLYIDEAFSAEAKARCENMVDHLLSAMGRAIRGAEWMGEATRAEALAKLDGFTYKIGYPDKWRDYSALQIERGPFVSNRMRAAAFEYDRQLDRLGDPVDKQEWAMPAHSVNAYYHPLLNEIVFPAGILQPPFFYAEADDAVNYGAIGAVIGHEITHGFDDRGSHFDAGGALRDWWTEQDRTEFMRRAEVLVQQFDGFVVAEDQHVNGRLTLGENIADLGGLKIAFDALREAIGDDAPPVDGLSPRQRFFISYASVWRMNYTDEHVRLLVNVDPHSPTEYRVNGPLANFPEFAEAFGIADGAPMVRAGDERAHIW